VKLPRYTYSSQIVPDWIVLFDANLLKNPMVMAGMSGKTSVLVNTGLTHGLDVPECKGLYVVDATSIAEELKLRTTSFSMVNTAMVGAFARASGLLDLESIEKVISQNEMPQTTDEGRQEMRLLLQNLAWPIDRGTWE
jgi:pyruvate ferredoxin oxidoreductase gamma subunit